MATIALAPQTELDHRATGPGAIAGRYMRNFWQPIYIGARLKPGRPVPLTVMGQAFTLFRDAHGAVHLLDARCPHRGAVLHIGRVEGAELRCFYHGWKFNGAGQCVEAPAELPGFAAKIKMRGYKVQEYLGLVFAYLGDGAPPQLPRYEEFETEGVLDIQVFWRLCNYFQAVENLVDPAHTPFTHLISGYTDSGLKGIPEVTGHESPWGVAQFGKRPDGGVRVSHFGMPNIINLVFQPAAGEEGGWRNLIAWLIPVDDDHHVTYLIRHVPVTGPAAERYRTYMAERDARVAALEPGHKIAQRILAGEKRIEDPDVLNHPDLFDIQDHITQMGQGVLADRSTEHLGRTDVLIATLRRIWTRELKALSEGRPVKDWARTPEIRATNGLKGAN